MEYETFKTEITSKVDKVGNDAHDCLLAAQAYAEKLDKIFEEAFEYFSK